MEVVHVEAAHGARIAVRTLGAGRPVLLVHGYFSTAQTMWLDTGNAQRIADAGFRVVMPDLRGHGDSSRPHARGSYPPDVLVDDLLAVVDVFGLTDFDLGGYSLGARVALRGVLRGLAPGRLVLGGQGRDAVTVGGDTGAYFRRVLTRDGPARPGSSEQLTLDWLEAIGGDRIALLHVLDSIVDTPPSALSAVAMPTLVAVGDRDVRDGRELAALLPRATYRELPGDHTTAALSGSGLGTAIAEFLVD